MPSDLHLLFSIIIPVFNRPQEVKELLQSLIEQTDKDFEIIIVEDGSEKDCRQETAQFSHLLNIQYYSKPNEGPGLTRNYGAKKAKGNYFIFFDSDCLIPPHYIDNVRHSLTHHWADAYGGPDRAAPEFSPLQKAISYSMTSYLTTGGIRGKKKKMKAFHPRSFNMGFSKAVFEATGGFASMRFGEDLDLSMRILEAGFTVEFIPQAFVYHKRRTSFRQFFKQTYNSGIARINLYKRHPKTLEAMHFAPAAFVLFCCFAVIMLLSGWLWPMGILIFYFVLIFIDSWRNNRNITVAWLSIGATIVQHFGYGTGFIIAFWCRIILGKPEFHAYRRNFYQ